MSIAVRQWLEREYRIDPRSLGVYRFLLAYVLCRFFTERSWIGGLSDYFFHPPPGPMHFFSGFPTEVQAETLVWVVWVALGFIALGFRTWVAALTFSTIAITIDGFAYSTEKIHHHILLYAAPVFLAFTPWATKYSVDPWIDKDPISRSSKNSYWPLCFLAVFIGAIFFSSGMLKLGGGWLDWDTQAARAHLVARHVSGWNRGFATKHADTFGSDPLWEVVDWFTVLFELSIIFSVVRLRYFRLALAAAAVFHLCMYRAMNPNFADYVIVYGAFVDWWGLTAWWRERSNAVKALLLFAVVPLTIFGAWSVATEGIKRAILYFGSAFAALYLLVHFVSYFASKFRAAGTAVHIKEKPAPST